MSGSGWAISGKNPLAARWGSVSSSPARRTMRKERELCDFLCNAVSAGDAQLVDELLA